jgi:hypothetical protein
VPKSEVRRARVKIRGRLISGPSSNLERSLVVRDDAALWPSGAGFDVGLDLHTRASQSSPARTFVLIFIVVSLSGVVGLLFATDATVTGLHLRLDLHRCAPR